MNIVASSTLSLNRWLPQRFLTLQDHGEALRVRIFLILIFLCVAPLLLLTLIMFCLTVIRYDSLWLPTLCVAVITFSQISCLLYFLKSGNINLCALIYASIIFVLVGTCAFFTGGWHSPVSIFLLALPVIACLVVSRNTGYIFSLAVLTLYVAFYLLEQRGYATEQLISPEYMPYAQAGMWFTSLSFIVGCLLLFDFSTMDLSRVIEKERIQFERDINVDDLTDTYNQESFLDEIDKCQMNQLENNQEFALIFIKIDNLRKINRQFGYEAGDYFLGKLAENIRQVSDNRTIVSRYTPESFAVLFNPVEDIGQLISMQFKLKQAAHKKILFRDEIVLSPELSFGIVISDGENMTPLDLIAQAEERASVEDSRLYMRV